MEADAPTETCGAGEGRGWSGQRDAAKQRLAQIRVKIPYFLNRFNLYYN
jgi:hypothetical protein